MFSPPFAGFFCYIRMNCISIRLLKKRASGSKSGHEIKFNLSAFIEFWILWFHNIDLGFAYHEANLLSQWKESHEEDIRRIKSVKFRILHSRKKIWKVLPLYRIWFRFNKNLRPYLVKYTYSALISTPQVTNTQKKKFGANFSNSSTKFQRNLLRIDENLRHQNFVPSEER